MSIKSDNAPLPENITRLIESRGLKQGAFAVKLGYSRQQFSDMMNGRKIIKPCDALAIAGALEVSMNTLFAAEKSETNGEYKNG